MDIERVAEKIRRAEEDLKKYKKLEADLKKKERERKERERDRWLRNLSKKMDDILRNVYGNEYFTMLSFEQILDIMKANIRNIEGDKDEN